MAEFVVLVDGLGWVTGVSLMSWILESIDIFLDFVLGGSSDI
jgi:hypothetical protein